MMNKVVIQTVLALALIAGLSPVVAGPDGWELAREGEGIRVYTRGVPGSDFHEVRGEAVIDAGLNRLMALLDDTPACVDWMYNCKNPRLLYKASLMDRYQYVVNDFPWPATDREMIVRNRIEQDQATRTTTVTLQGVGRDALPEPAKAALPGPGDLVPVDRLEGFFELTPLDAGGTRVVYQLHLEPGGKLAAGVVNAKTVDNPFETLKAMRQVVQRDKYRCFNPF